MFCLPSLRDFSNYAPVTEPVACNEKMSVVS